MKQRILLIAFLMTVCSYCMAVKRGYAVYTSEDKTITCYDDGKMSSRPGTVKFELIDANSAGSGIDGFDKNIKRVFEKVKFDPSFISAKFRSITCWFEFMAKLTTIEGLENWDTSEVTTVLHQRVWSLPENLLPSLRALRQLTMDN